MSHKTAKKIRKLLNKAINKPEGSTANPVTQREYTENTKNRKKQLVELKTGEKQEIEVSYGTMRVNSDSGRGIYKMVKRAMTGKSAPAKRAPQAAPIIESKPGGNIPPQGELKLVEPEVA